MQIVELNEKEYGGQILDIFNHAIINTTALFDYKPRSPDSMKGWFEAKRRGRYPVLGAVDDGRKLLGFVSYGQFRAWPAYKYSVEHSVYVHHEHRRRGIADLLMTAIKSAATNQAYHVLIGGIEAKNTASIKLHEKHGFTNCGTITQVGFKFGRWLDLTFYQMTLMTPANPSDG